MPPAPPLASAGEPLAGRYRLTQRITALSDGEVWRGTDVVLGRPVAVELLRIEFPAGHGLLARFREKARHAGVVTHAGIARIYDYDEACFPHPPFLVMELTDGPSLAEVIAGSSPVEPGRVMDITAQVAAALQAMHHAGLVHRAVRPENMLTTRDGQVKLTCLESLPAMGTAGYGPPPGDACYLAPEQLTGHPGTAASDMYALGVVACQCLTGRLPPGGAAAEVTPADQMRPVPPLPAAIPAEVTGLLTEVTARDPARRPGAAEVASRAAQLSDRMRAGVQAQPSYQRASLLPAGGLPLTRGADALPEPGRTLPATPPQLAHLSGRKWTWRHGLLPSLVIPVVVIAGMFLGMRDHGPQRLVPATTTLVEVNAAALEGRPVAEVRMLLRRLGLAVRLQWRPSHQVPAGRVISVTPAGRVPGGTLVTVTGASRPAGMSHSAGDPGAGTRPAGGHRKRRPPATRPTAARSTAPAGGPTARAAHLARRLGPE